MEGLVLFEDLHAFLWSLQLFVFVVSQWSSGGGVVAMIYILWWCWWNMTIKFMLPNKRVLGNHFANDHVVCKMVRLFLFFGRSVVFLACFGRLLMMCYCCCRLMMIWWHCRSVGSVACIFVSLVFLKGGSRWQWYVGVAVAMKLLLLVLLMQQQPKQIYTKIRKIVA